MKKSCPDSYTDNVTSLITQHRPRSKARIRSPVRMKRICLTLLSILPLTGTLAFINPSQLRTKSTNYLQTSATKLNGIRGFRGWFESQFPDAIREIPKDNTQETFNHVLIDINQLLHIAVRRSRTDDHALAIMMRELNSCVEFAKPTTSLVLAMDGAASAAKLATSRKRRLTTIVKSEWKQKQLDRFRESKKLSLNENQEKKLRERFQCDVKTLRITTGTDFMDRANNALLYWACQRMHAVKKFSKVSIYISSSLSPGEGEIKIIDWIIQNRPTGTVAIIGGDSDLVLEGLLIPPSICTHNIFVLLPDTNRKYQVVSLWETTRHIANLLPPVEAKDIMYVRTDLALVLILNGNDYLPKLRGSSGFHRVFTAYIKVVKNWLKAGHKRPFLIDPQSLVFNREFAVQFFSKLISSRSLDNPGITGRTLILTPLGQLNNLVSSKFMPKPMEWKISSGYNGLDEELDEEEEEDDVFEEDQEEDDDAFENVEECDSLFSLNSTSDLTLRLTLGKKGSKDYYCYETKHGYYSRMKETKNKLAMIALDDLMGPDYCKTAINGTQSVPSLLYDWEIERPIEASSELYLAGLIWNLQTYQDGVCSDYGYNYGKRLSPTAEEMKEYFQSAIDKNRQVGKNELLGSNFTYPMDNGVSGLAMLPSQLQKLIAEPYSRIPGERVEELYGECVSPVDNVFNIQKFKDLCKVELEKSLSKTSKKKEVKQKLVELGSDFWTIIFRTAKVLQTPFQPPEPILDRFKPLFINPRIKASRLNATLRPYERKAWVESIEDKDDNLFPHEIDFCDIGKLLARRNGGTSTISDVNYFTPYSDKWKSKRPKKKAANAGKAMESKKSTEAAKETKIIKGDRQKEDRKQQINQLIEFKLEKNNTPKQKILSDIELNSRLKEFGLEIDPSVHPEESIHGKTALSKLVFLWDAKMISIKWRSLIPSPTEFASINPAGFECIELTVIKVDLTMDSTIGDKVVFRRDREITRGSSRRARQYLASLALTRILKGKKNAWYEMTNNDMKSVLNPAKPTLYSESDETRKRMEDFDLEPLALIERSKTGQTAMEYLEQLRKAKYLEYSWSSLIPSPTDFASVDPKRFQCIVLIIRNGELGMDSTIDDGEVVRFHRDREIHRGISKRRTRQYLASVALTRILEDKNKNWHELSYEDLTRVLKRKN